MEDARVVEQEAINLSGYSGVSERTKSRHRSAIKNSITRELQVEVECISNNYFSLSPPLFSHNDNNDSPSEIESNLENNNAPHISLSNDIDTNFATSLISWSHDHNISHSALDALLKILKPYHASLPKDSRTLLRTPKQINVRECDAGSYIYFGLLPNILERASTGLIDSQNYPIIDLKKLQIDSDLLTVTVNVDGLPVHSSTNYSFWPILCILDQCNNKKPFIVGLFYGESKPNNVNNYLRPFVDECFELETNGITIQGKKYAFRLSCIVADAPARAFIKSIKSHNSLHGCEKCTQEGVYIGRTTWQYSRNLNLRNDLDFNNVYYEDHQIAKSILTELDVGLVTQVPLDYMHLVCLGVVKKLIRVWIENGPKKCKLNFLKVTTISQRLLEIKKHYPAEFSRRPRPIQLFKHWKATEFRSFVLYLGPVVLLNILSKNLYEHFLALHCAIYILCSDFCSVSEWRTYANDLLHCFVRNVPTLYSKELLVYNFHNLLHLTADTEKFGNLDNFSAFPFENFMSKIKQMVRSHSHPLEQVAKRMGELKCTSKHTQKTTVIVRKKRIVKVILDTKCILSVNSCFNTKEGDIVVIKSIEEFPERGSYKLECDNFLDKVDFYTVPVRSSLIGIYKVSRTEKKNISSSTLNKKCLLLPNFIENDSFICIPFVSMTLSH